MKTSFVQYLDKVENLNSIIANLVSRSDTNIWHALKEVYQDYPELLINISEEVAQQSGNPAEKYTSALKTLQELSNGLRNFQSQMNQNPQYLRLVANLEKIINYLQNEEKANLGLLGAQITQTSKPQIDQSINKPIISNLNQVGKY